MKVSDCRNNECIPKGNRRSLVSPVSQEIFLCQSDVPAARQSFQTMNIAADDSTSRMLMTKMPVRSECDARSGSV